VMSSKFGRERFKLTRQRVEAVLEKRNASTAR
jgi:hypothetical protein